MAYDLDVSGIEKLADFLLSRVSERFLKHGRLETAVFGISVDEGKVRVLETPVVGEVHEELPRRLRELQASHDLVASVVEAWSAPDSVTNPAAHPHRKEIILIALYAKARSFTLMAQIYRNPLRVLKDTFSEQPQFIGTLTPNGSGASDEHLELERAHLMRVLRTLPDQWRPHTRGILMKQFLAGCSAELWRALATQDRSSEAHEYAHRAFERLFSIVPMGEDAELGTRTHGVVTLLRIPAEATHVGQDAYQIARNFIKAYQGIKPPKTLQSLWFIHPRSPALAFDYVPASLLFEAIRDGYKDLLSPREARTDALTRLDKMQAELLAHRQLHPAYAGCDTLVAVLGLYHCRSREGVHETNPTLPDPDLTVGLNLESARLNEAAQALSAQVGVKVDCEGAFPLFEGMRVLCERHQDLQISKSLSMNALLNYRRPEVAQLTLVETEKPRGSTLIGVYRDKAGAFGGGLRLDRWGHEAYPEMAQRIAERIRLEGVSNVQIYPKVLRVVEWPLEPSTRLMKLPDFKGGWFSLREELGLAHQQPPD